MKKFIRGLRTKFRMHLIAYFHLGYGEVLRIARYVESYVRGRSVQDRIMRSDRFLIDGMSRTHGDGTGRRRDWSGSCSGDCIDRDNGSQIIDIRTGQKRSNDNIKVEIHSSASRWHLRVQ